AGGISCLDPMWTDDRKQDCAARNLIVELLYEIEAWFNGINVHEHVLLTKFFGQTVMQTPGNPGGLVATIIDENLVGQWIVLDLQKRFYESDQGTVFVWSNQFSLFCSSASEPDVPPQSKSIAGNGRADAPVPRAFWGASCCTCSRPVLAAKTNAPQRRILDH